LGEAATNGSVRERLADTAWVGVVLVMVVLGLLTVFAVRYATMVDTMRARVDEDGAIVAEIPEGAAADVAVGQPARARVSGNWYEGRVAEVGANALPAADGGSNGDVRYVRVRVVLDAAGSELPTDEPIEVRIITGWRLP